MDKNKIKIIILAAGKGTRMKSDLPKVLETVKGKPIIKYLLESIEKSDINGRPVIVVGYGKEKVMETLGNNYDYAIQEEQLGTGHAVAITQKILENNTDHIMVLYGDHPLISPETIKKLKDTHLASNKKITMATFTVPDFDDWRAVFYKNFSRIIRDPNGDIIKDVQFKDTNDEEKKVKELNPCYFCFEARWLWENLKRLNTDNAQKEYYLTDLVKIAMKEKDQIQSINIDPHEALGINSKEELETLEKLVV
ncbi:MAG: NTP transferase domain-containing protein [Candidatus Paceibacterota bacterium]|jgi:bifunctional UDP-N-acetylglucosamine pyrophosphorylase/glucosamine-1-phosphate N-acetyltransferase